MPDEDPNWPEFFVGLAIFLGVALIWVVVSYKLGH